MYDAYLTTFVTRELGKHLNMSFDEFLNHPKHQIEAMIRVISKIQDKKNQVTESTLNSIKNSSKKTPDIDNFEF